MRADLKDFLNKQNILEYRAKKTIARNKDNNPINKTQNEMEDTAENKDMKRKREDDEEKICKIEDDTGHYT